MGAFIKMPSMINTLLVLTISTLVLSCTAESAANHVPEDFEVMSGDSIQPGQQPAELLSQQATNTEQSTGAKFAEGALAQTAQADSAQAGWRRRRRRRRCSEVLSQTAQADSDQAGWYRRRRTYCARRRRTAAERSSKERSSKEKTRKEKAGKSAKRKERATKEAKRKKSHGAFTNKWQRVGRGVCKAGGDDAKGDASLKACQSRCAATSSCRWFSARVDRSSK